MTQLEARQCHSNLFRVKPSVPLLTQRTQNVGQSTLKWTPRVGQWETLFKRELADVVSTVASDDRVLCGRSR